MIDVDAWRGRRVLVTGHTGFKGTWLAVWLDTLGAVVAGYALDPPTQPNLFDAAGIASLLEDHRGDIRDANALRRVVEDFDPELVFHLAAQPLVLGGYTEPVETFAVNVVGTAALLDACRHARGLRAIVNVTTDKCYENRDWVWGYRENDALGGRDPYSASKACSELVTDAFRRSFFGAGEATVGVATARAGNVIGGGDWAQDRLVADAARAVRERRPLVVRSPQAIRPWQHVLEPLCGYLLLAEHLLRDPARHSSAWNFGPDGDAFHTVASVLERLSARWHGRLAWSAQTSGRHPHEAARLALDSTKAHRELGWAPRLDLDEALDLTVQGYEAHASGAGMHEILQAQIAWYAQHPGRGARAGR